MLARAIWPQGVADETRDAVLDEVAYWLGTDGIGRPHLAADASGRLRLGSGVKVDWHVFLTLVAQAGQAAGPGGKGSHGGHAPEEAKLAQALSLVDGHFLAGCGPGGYSWIVTDGLEYEVSARVADAAHRLCELRLNDGDSRGAMDAVRTGLRIAPDDELLWRDLLTAAHATGQENMLYAAAGRDLDPRVHGRAAGADHRDRGTPGRAAPDLALDACLTCAYAAYEGKAR